MNILRCDILYVCAVMALVFAACADDDVPVFEEGAVACADLRFRVADMMMSPVSRALEPMSPDVEKYVRSLAVFEFDNEGLHDKTSTTYHYVDFVKGTVDGVYGVGGLDSTEYGVVESSLRGLQFESRSNGTLCLVANVTEDQVDDFYDSYREPGQSYGRITFDRFKMWALPFDYKETEAGVYDETYTGHLETMYMFGYYQGVIDPSAVQGISVDLGRMASRLDITVVNETGEPIKKRLGYHFDEVGKSAYFFPIKTSMPASEVGVTRTVICSGVGDAVTNARTEVPETFADKGRHTRYFYVAAHSAVDESEATKIHIFYDTRVPRDDDNIGADVSHIQVPLCNVHPSHAGSVFNGYSLSRNTRYHFTIRLRKASEEVAVARSEISDTDPSDITVYLP